MSRFASSGAEVRRTEFRRRYTPLVVVILTCFISLLPIIVTAPMLPDFAFLVLVAWRLLRPELWPATIALPLGFFNDLVSGDPLGQSMALWTIVFLAFEFLDSRLLYRDYWMDWFFASLAIISYIFGNWVIARLMDSGIELIVMLPQTIISILIYPAVARIVLGLDRWRVSR